VFRTCVPKDSRELGNLPAARPLAFCHSALLRGPSCITPVSFRFCQHPILFFFQRVPDREYMIPYEIVSWSPPFSSPSLAPPFYSTTWFAGFSMTGFEMSQFCELHESLTWHQRQTPLFACVCWFLSDFPLTFPKLFPTPRSLRSPIEDLTR